MRLLFELVDSVKKTALHNVREHHPIHFGPEYNKRQGMEEFALTFFFLTHCLSWNSSSPALRLGFTPLTSLVLRPLA